jgi:hypothetical protein
MIVDIYRVHNEVTVHDDPDGAAAAGQGAFGACMIRVARLTAEEDRKRSARRMGRALIAAGERGGEISAGSSFLSVYDSSFGGHQ